MSTDQPTGKDKILCSKCTKLFDGIDQLSTHQKHIPHCEVDMAVMKPHQCPTCNKRFCIKNRLMSHMATCEGQPTSPGRIDKIYSCEECEKQFTSRAGRLYHRSRVHGIGKVIERTSSKKTDTSEIKIEPSDSTEIPWTSYLEMSDEFVCGKCSMSFSTKAALIVHEKYSKTCNIDMELFKPFKCPTCPRRFVRKSNLLTHKCKNSLKGML